MGNTCRIKLHEGKDVCHFCSLMCPQGLEQCLTYSGHSINIYGKNERRQSSGNNRVEVPESESFPEKQHLSSHLKNTKELAEGAESVKVGWAGASLYEAGRGQHGWSVGSKRKCSGRWGIWVVDTHQRLQRPHAGFGSYSQRSGKLVFTEVNKGVKRPHPERS